MQHRRRPGLRPPGRQTPCRARPATNLCRRNSTTLGLQLRFRGKMSDEKKPVISAEKPQDQGNPDHITLNVRAQDGDVVKFKIKKTTLLKKLMSTYCDKKNLQREHIRFLFDGKRLDDNATPELLEMEEDDCIDAMLHQVGGHMDILPIV